VTEQISIYKVIHIALDESEEIALMAALADYMQNVCTQPISLEKIQKREATYSLLLKLGTQLGYGGTS